tara:strand:- start:1231 stop:8955 length:7725 start_codon:yes stop_codon:yes gene_type:complete
MPAGTVDDLLSELRASRAASAPDVTPTPVPTTSSVNKVDVGLKEDGLLPGSKQLLAELRAKRLEDAQPDVVPEDVLDTPYSEELLSGYGKYGVAEMPPERLPDDVFFEDIPGFIVSGRPTISIDGPGAKQTIYSVPDTLPEDPPEAILAGHDFDTVGKAVTRGDLTGPAAAIGEHIPPALRDKLKGDPEEVEKMSRDQASRLWHMTYIRYNSTRDPIRKAQVLGDFIRRWNPRLAGKLGYTKEGYTKPEGWWKFFDVLDAYTRRPLAAITNTAMDLRRWEIAKAASPGKFKNPTLPEALSLLQQNYAGDKGALEDFAKQLTNTALYIATTGGVRPEGVSEQAYAKSLLESMDTGAEEVEHDIAEKLTAAGYEMYDHPILTGVGMGALGGAVLTKTPQGALIGGLTGLLGGSAIEANKWWGGVSAEELERAKQEAIEEGSVGGHLAYALGGAISLDPINALGSLSKGAVAVPKAGAAARIMGTGLDLSARGVEVATRHTKRLTDQARLKITAHQAATHGVDAVAPLSDINKQISRVDQAISRHHARVDELTIGDKPRASRISGETIPEEIERVGSQINSLRELRSSLLNAFDEANDTLLSAAPKKGAGITGVPSVRSKLKNFIFSHSNSRKLLEEQSKLLAVKDFLKATTTALKGEVRILGDFAVEELSRLTRIPMDEVNKLRLESGVKGEKLPANYFEGEWVKGLKSAEEKGEVLVRVDVDNSGKVTHVTKPPDVARIYRWATDGELGEAARVAAMRPGDGVLEKLLKRGLKGQPKWDDLVARAKTELKALHTPNTSIVPGVRRSLTERAVEWATSKAYLAGRGGKSFGAAIDDILPPIPKGFTKDSLKASRAIRGESLVNNIEPLYFTLGYAMARAVPWMDPVRRALGGLLFTPRVGFGAKPQIYTELAEGTGFLARYGLDRQVLPKAHLEHPATWRLVGDAFRNRARVASHLRERLPKAKLQILKITDDPTELSFLSHFAEMGWDSVKQSDKALAEFMASVSLRKLEKVVDTITLPYRAAEAEPGKVSTSFRLEKADAEGVLEAIRTLRELSTPRPDSPVAAIPVIDKDLLNSLERTVLDHLASTDEIKSLEAQRAAVRAGSPTSIERLQNLKLLKDRLALFTASYDAKVGGKIAVDTELDVARMADGFQPEIQRIQSALSLIEERLALKSGDPTPSQPISGFVGDVLREAEEFLPSIPGRTFEERLFRPDEAAALGAPEKLRTTAATDLPQWKVRKDDSTLSPEMHLAEVQAAVKAGKRVPVDVLLDYPIEVIGRVRADLKKGLRKVREAQSKLRAASDDLALLRQRLVDEGVDPLKSTQFKKAQRNIRSAQADLAKVRSSSFLASLRRAISRVEKAVADKDLVVPIGSKARHTLEATRQLYKNRMLDIQALIEGEATVIRARGDARRAAATISIAPMEKMTHLQRGRLDRAIDALNTNLRGPKPEVASLPTKEVNRLLKELSDPALSARVAEMRLAISREPSQAKKRAMRRKLETELNSALSSREARASELVGTTPLAQALSIPKTRSALSGLPGPAITRRGLYEKLDNIDAELANLSKTLDDLDYDLRTPEQQRKSLTQTIDSSVNALAESAAKFWNRLEALKKAEIAKAIGHMTPDEQARVARMVKNPDLYNLKAGKKNLVTDLKAQRARLVASVDRLEAAGKKTTKAKKSIANIDEQIRVLGDDASVERIVGAASIMRQFFDKWFDDLKAAGLFAEMDRNAFLSRVNIGAYVKHMADRYSAAKVAAFQGSKVPLWASQRLGGSAEFFKHERKLDGLMREINKASRKEFAESVVKDRASSGVFGKEAQQVAKQKSKSASTMRTFFERKGVNYENIVDDVMAEGGFNELHNFFETDPFVIMTRYNDMGSKTVSDVAFLEDVLDIFPAGREFRSATAADEAGFERLDKVSELEGVLRKRLPQKLRDYEDIIRQNMVDGVPVDEIKDILEKEGVVVDDDVLHALRGRDKYIPKAVGEYVRWNNDPVAQQGVRALFGDLYDGVHSWMKAQSTILAFAHIGRNWLSNVVSTSQELGWAALNPVTQMQAAMIWGSFRKGDAAFGLDVPVKIGDKVMTRGEWRQFFRDRGFFEAPLSTDFMNEQAGLAALDAIPTARDLFIRSGAATAGSFAGGAITSALGLGPAPGMFAGTAVGVGLGKRWNGAKEVAGGSVWEKFIGMSMKDSHADLPRTVSAIGHRTSGAAIGAAVGSVAGAPGAAIGAVLGGVTMPDYLKMMGMFNTSVEAQARLSLGVAAMKKGDDASVALSRVNASLRDYSDLTPLEKRVLRRVFFFYTWEAGNFKYQLDWLRRNPRAANSIMSFVDGVYKQQFTEREYASLPDPWKYRILARHHQSRLVALSGLPWEPMVELLSKKTKTLPAPIAGLAGRLNPMPLTAVEWVAGTSFYYDRGWRELTNVRQLVDTPPLYQWAMGVPTEDEVVDKTIWKNGVPTGLTRGVYKSKNPVLFYLAQRFPGNRAMRIYSEISTDTFNTYAMDAGDPTVRATWPEKAAAFGLGWKNTTIDMEAMQNYAAIELADEMKSEIRLINDVISKDNKMRPNWTEQRRRAFDELQEGFNE